MCRKLRNDGKAKGSATRPIFPRVAPIAPKIDNSMKQSGKSRSPSGGPSVQGTSGDYMTRSPAGDLTLTK